MRRFLFQLAASVFLLTATTVSAADLRGTFTQGGLVIGQAAPGSTVVFQGRRIPVGPDGSFLLGFGRDAKPRAELSVVAPDGTHDHRTLAIKQRQYKISRVDGLPRRHVTPDPKAVKRIRADNVLISRIRGLDSDVYGFLDGFAWPVQGRVSGVFGSQRILNGKPKSPHNGVDVAAPEGTLIRAPAAGVVAMTHDDMFYTGKTVMVDHGRGLTSVYAHMSAILVLDGQKVAKGDPIGRVGKSGRATGPHLHWGVTVRSTHLDPMLLTGPMPK